MAFYIKNQDGDYVNTDCIVAVSKDFRVENAFCVITNGEGATITFKYSCEEECVDSLSNLLRELDNKKTDRWVFLSEVGFAVKANIVRYIQKDGEGFKFETDSGVWHIHCENEQYIEECKDLLLGRRTESNLEEFGMHKFM